MLLYFFFWLVHVFLCNSITLTNIATSGNGINFGRVPSVEHAFRKSIDALVNVSASELLFTYPQTTAGFPGVALIDFNNDNCIDIMVPNGPGANHSLYKNNCDGTFTDIANTANIGDIDIDGSGACFGDLDNDGDDDIVIAGRASFNNIFMNNGDETFTKSNAINTPGQDKRWGCTCSLGDVNNDGYLDIFIGNCVKTLNHGWILGENLEEGGTFTYNDHNELFLNNQDGTYTDITNTSGILNTILFPIPFSGNPTVTWANALVDINQDGNIDLILADDQAGATHAEFFGIDRGYIQIFLGDGNGFFTSYPQKESGLYDANAWMGLAFGDLNCDDELDLFASNFGDYGLPNLADPRIDLVAIGALPFGLQLSRELYGQGSILSSFYDPVHELRDVGIPTVFGWGCAITDIENDGDLDVIYYGGLDNGHNSMLLDNPGMILLNSGCNDLNKRNRVKFTRDTQAIPFDPNCNIHANGFVPVQTCTSHNLRSVHGVAVGDINNDGFNDIITVADWTIVGTDNKLQPSAAIYGNELDDTGFAVVTWTASSNSSNPNQAPGTGIRRYVGDDFNPGDLFIEVNSGNSNNWIQILLVGGMGILDTNTYNTLSNRNGFGALIRFFPIINTRPTLYHCSKANDIEDEYNNQIFIPLVAGESHLSQHSSRKTFGLGNNKRGAVDITWPSGYKNIVYYLQKNNMYKIYEIPLSYDNCNLTINEIISTIQAVGVTYGLTFNEIRRYRKSFRLKWRQECSQHFYYSKNSGATHGNSNGTYIYLYVIGAILGILLIGFGVLIIIRKKYKKNYKINQINLQKENNVTKVKSESITVF